MRLLRAIISQIKWYFRKPKGKKGDLYIRTFNGERKPELWQYIGPDSRTTDWEIVEEEEKD